MQARDVMTFPVITVRPASSIKDAAKLFLERRISAAPVVDARGELLGIVSEGDLMHRSEIGTERQRPWWLVAMAEDQGSAADYIKAHAKRIADVMTRNVVTATPETPLNEIAAMLERNAIKRVPIVRHGQLVGIVSRANLVQALATAGSKLDVPLSDATIRERLLAHLKAQRGPLNVTINDGIVDLWGITDSETEHTAIRVAAEATPGVRAVNDRMVVWHRHAVA
jgi:CBS domain-containing protein